MVSSKNSNRKRVFEDGRNFTQGHFGPQSCHLVRLARKIGEVRFNNKIQTENGFFGKNEFERAFEAKLSKFSSETILPPNAPCRELGSEKWYGDGFIEKFQPKTCF